MEQSLPPKKQEIIREIILELDSFDFNKNHYYNDLEPQSHIDDFVFSKVKALKKWAEGEGWTQIVQSFDSLEMIPGRAPYFVEELRGFTFPEMLRMCNLMEKNDSIINNEAIWEIIHPRIKAIARSRFESNHYSDAVEAVFKELNTVIKNYVKRKTNEEYDGAKLMRRAFSPNNPLVLLGDLDSESGKSYQNGFMDIFAGAIMGIRNPHAHDNLDTDKPKAIHLIYLASLLMYTFDERIEESQLRSP